MPKYIVISPRYDLPDLVDKLILTMCQLHDGSALWEHTKRDPEAFRRVMKDCILKFEEGE